METTQRFAVSPAVALRKTINDIKSFIRQPYAWPGAYPLYLVMNDGGSICKTCAKSEYWNILHSTKFDYFDGWHVHGVDVNWESTDLCCDHCSNPIESAHGDI